MDQQSQWYNTNCQEVLQQRSDRRRKTKYVTKEDFLFHPLNILQKLFSESIYFWEYLRLTKWNLPFGIESIRRIHICTWISLLCHMQWKSMKGIFQTRFFSQRLKITMFFSLMCDIKTEWWNPRMKTCLPYPLTEHEKPCRDIIKYDPANEAFDLVKKSSPLTN